MKLRISILMAGALVSACSQAEAPATPPPAVAVSETKSADKGPKNYKAIFGPDYQKGDIGHSKGILIDKGNAAKTVVIEHGVIHGIERGAETTKFETLDTVDLSPLSSGVKVEFLVKKGPDTIYRLFAICEILEAGKSCL